MTQGTHAARHTDENRHILASVAQLQGCAAADAQASRAEAATTVELLRQLKSQMDTLDTAGRGATGAAGTQAAVSAQLGQGAPTSEEEIKIIHQVHLYDCCEAHMMSCFLRKPDEQQAHAIAVSHRSYRVRAPRLAGRRFTL